MKKYIATILISAIQFFSVIAYGFAIDGIVVPVSDVKVSANADSATPGQLLVDGNGSTAVRFTEYSIDGYAEATLACRTLVYGIRLSGHMGPATGFVVEYERDGVWHAFTGATGRGFDGTGGLLDLSFDRIVTDRIALRLAGADVSEAQLSELVVLGRDASSISAKIQPVALVATDNTCYFTPEENITDGNVRTVWKTRSLPVYEGLVGLVKDFLKGLKDRRYNMMKSPYEAEIVFDLGSEYALDHLNVFFAEGAMGSVTLQIMQNGEWTTVRYFPDGMSAGWASAPVEPDDVRTTSVRLIVQGASWILGGIGELEIWGRGTYPGDRYVPIGLRGPIPFDRQIDSVFTLDRTNGAELEIELAGEYTGAISCELDGEAVGPWQRVRVGANTVLRSHVSAERLWTGDNFLSIKETTVAVDFIAARLRLRADAGTRPFEAGGFTDDVLLTAPTEPMPQEIALGESVFLGRIELATVGQLSANVSVNVSGVWTDLYETSRDEGRIVFDGAGLTIDALRIAVAGPGAVADVSVIGSPTGDTRPDVTVLYPYDGTNLGILDVVAGLLIGFIDDPNATVTVNGLSVERFNHYFWIRLRDLGLATGDAYVLEARAADSAGRTDTSSVTVTVGLSKLLTIDQPDEIIHTDQPQVRISGSVISTKHRVEINDANVPIVSKTFSKDVTLEHGLNIIKIRLIHDASGKALAIAFRKVFRYSGDVSLSIDTPRNGTYVMQRTIAVSGSVTGLAPLRVWVNGVAAAVSGFRYACPAIPLAEGENAVNVIAEDSRGYANIVQVIVYCDTIAPVLDSIVPTEGAVSPSSSVVVSGNITDASPAWVTVNGTPAPIENGAWNTTLSLTDGIKTLTILALDAAGNSTTSVVSITVDTVPPLEFDVTADPSGWTNNPQPVIAFAATDATSGIDHYECAIDGGEFVVVTSPYTLPPQVDGEHAIVVRATDRAGHVTTAGTSIFIDTTPPSAPIGFRGVSGEGTITLKWMKPDEDVTSYRIWRTPEWTPVNEVTTGEEAYTDTFTEINAYVYEIIAIDHAGNESAIAISGIEMPGVEIQDYTPDGGAIVEFENATLAILPGSLPENVKKIVVTKIESAELDELAYNPIVSPIYSFHAIVESDGEDVLADHVAFSENFYASISYDKSMLPPYFPEENLDVYYFNNTWSRWKRVEESFVDKEHGRIFFRADHFSDYSVQPTLIDDLSPQEIKEAGHSPFKTEISHQGVTVSPEGGSVHTEATELSLPGMNGFDLVLKRMYDHSLARTDASGFGINASIGINFLRLQDSLGELTDLSGLGFEIASQLQEKIKTYFQNNGDYSYSMGAGWRLNLPYIRGYHGGVIVRLPSGAFFPVEEMDRVHWENATGFDRQMTLANHTNEDFTLWVHQIRSDIDFVSFAKTSLAVPGMETQITQNLSMLATKGKVTSLTATDYAQTAGSIARAGSSIIAAAVPGWQTVEAKLTLKDGTVYDFDMLGRVQKITDPTGKNIIEINYNMLVIDNIVDSMGRVVKFEYTDFLASTSNGLTPYAPRIKKMYVENDNTYARTIDYQHDAYNSGFPPELLSRVTYRGTATGADGIPTPVERAFEYGYDCNFLQSMGGSAKLNIVSTIADLFTGGLFSAITGWDNLTLNGHVKMEYVFPLKEAKGPGIGRAVIANEARRLEYAYIDLADYFLGFLPVSVEVGIELENRILASRIDVYDDNGTLSSTTSYGYDIRYASDRQFYTRSAMMNDGRMITNWNYGYKAVKNNAFVDWSDIALQLISTLGFVEQERRTVRTYNTSVSRSTVLGIPLETETFDWNGSKTKITERLLYHGADNRLTTNFSYDTWGNPIVTVENAESPGREVKVETRTLHYLLGMTTQASYDEFIALVPGDARLTLPAYGIPVFESGINIRNLPLVQATINTVPATGETPAHDVTGVTVMKYNSLGQRIADATWTGSEWAETTYEYNDPYGRMTKKTAPNEHVTDIAYEDNATPDLYTVTVTEQGLVNILDDTGTTALDAISSTTAYEKISGWKRSETNPRGFVTDYTYDSLGRLTSIRKPAGTGEDRPLTVIAYNDTEYTSTVTGPRGTAVTYDYDALGRLIFIDKTNRTRDDNGTITGTQTVSTAIGYNAWGDITSITDPNNRTTDYEYDALGRTKRITYPSDTGTRPLKTMDFDYGTNLLAIRDERGNITYEQYDMKERLLKRTRYDGPVPVTTTTYYDGLGNTVRTIDPNGNTTDIEYDQRGLAIRETLPESTFAETGVPEGQPYRPIVRHTYDTAGHKIADIVRIDGQDETIGYVIDGLGRTIATTRSCTDYASTDIVKPKVTVTETVFYDRNGNKKKVTDANGNASIFTYSARDKVIAETDPLSNTTTYNYDADDNKTGMTDPRGNTNTYDGDFTIAYVYDDLGRLIRGELPKNNGATDRPIVRLEYDPRGNLMTRTEPDGGKTLYTYTARNKPETETTSGTRADGTPASYTITHRYDSANNEIATIDTHGNETTRTYDSLDRPVYIEYPENNTEAFDYDPNGNLTRHTDGKEKNTITEYNAYNKPVKTTDPRGGITTTAYDTRGNIIRTTDANGNTTAYAYDELGRLVQETDAGGRTRTYAYDKAGNKIRSKDPNGTELAYTYTPTNLLADIVHNSTTIGTYTYDEAGDIKAIMQLGATTTKNTIGGTYTPDPYSLVWNKTTTAGGQTTRTAYDYDTMNRTTDVTYNSGRTINYDYNNIGQLERVPGYVEEAPVYDNGGLLAELKAANGIATTYTYDRNNRLDILSYKNRTTQLDSYDYAYDSNNNITKKNNSLYAYDELNQLINANLNGKFEIDVRKKTQNIGKTEQDFAGQEELAFGISDVELKLDYASMSIGVALGGEYDINKIEIHPDATGHRVTQRNLEVYTAKTNNKGTYTRATGWTINTRDDNTMEILFPTVVKASYVKLHCHYDDRDKEENPVNKATVKNLKNEIIKVFYMLNWRYENYSYDPKGNRTTSSVTLDETKTKNYTYYPNSDRLKTDGAYGYVWDPNGNLTEKGTTYEDSGNTLIFDNTNGEYWRYEYDIFNRMIKVSKSSAGTANLHAIAEYTYDAENLRIRKNSTKNGDTFYVYGLNGEIMSEGTATESIDYVYVNGRHFAMITTETATNTTTTYYYSLDHLGSTVMMTDASGAVVWKNEATPFGEWSGEIGIMHLKGKFTGKDLDDEIGLYYFNARWMDPETGRFTSGDPAKDGVNWYGYVGNNPLRYIDPTGKQLAEGLQKAQEIINNTPPDPTVRAIAVGVSVVVIGGYLIYGVLSTGDPIEKPPTPGPAPTPEPTPDVAPQEIQRQAQEHSPNNTQNSDSNGNQNKPMPALPPNYKWENGRIIAPNGIQIGTVDAAWKHAEGKSDWADSKQNDNLNWGDPDTLDDHFDRHGKDFNAKNADEYAKKSQDFKNNAKTKGCEVKVDSKGVTRIYDPNTNTFGSYNADGSTKTFYKPNPSIHGKATNMEYWELQPGE